MAEVLAALESATGSVGGGGGGDHHLSTAPRAAAAAALTLDEIGYEYSGRGQRQLTLAEQKVAKRRQEALATKSDIEMTERTKAGAAPMRNFDYDEEVPDDDYDESAPPGSRRCSLQ